MNREMNHATDEELVELYYGAGEEAQRARHHLEECAWCREAFLRWQETLDAVKEYPVPHRPANYGSAVWARVQARLPKHNRRWLPKKWWILTPALAAALAIAFIAGTWTEHNRALKPNGAAPTEKARERVLLLAIGNHLERSEIVLTELMHADPRTADLTAERGLARDLVNENRLLRERAAQTGDAADAALLEDVQRVLLDLANGSADSPGDVEAVQRRIEDGSLLFKVRIRSVNAYRRGQKL
jgi:hypothetical protein